ncbi:MAG: prepilin peptidase [Proteobacteria bacterium]|nr:prepilin peptidase [Pseudomonadota bacterium]
MDAPDIIGIVLMGLVLGSFATALSYRLPLDMSIVTVTRSRCPVCQHNLGIADLVPLFSWLFLRGRCRHCQTWIGWRYPLIELATLFLCFIFYAVYGLRADTLLIFSLAPVLISILDIDFHHKIIPDSLNLAVLLTGAALLSVNTLMDGNPTDFLIYKGGEAVSGALAYGLGSLLLRQVAMRVLKREPMGLGDVKFYAAVGFWLGLNANATSLFLIISGISGVVLALIWKRRTGEIEVPFGPSLIIAFIVTLCFYPPDFVSV